MGLAKLVDAQMAQAAQGQSLSQLHAEQQAHLRQLTEELTEKVRRESLQQIRAIAATFAAQLASRQQPASQQPVAAVVVAVEPPAAVPAVARSPGTFARVSLPPPPRSRV